MSGDIAKHPGLNLGPGHGNDSAAAEGLMFGFWVFMMSDAILFGMVFATYLTSLSATAGGPVASQLYDLTSTFVETLLLLASSFTFGMASLAMKYRHSQRRLVSWLLVTLLLGLAFISVELHDFASMAAKGGVPTRSGFLSAFFDLVPLHGLHVAAGCLWMIALARHHAAGAVLAFSGHHLDRHFFSRLSTGVHACRRVTKKSNSKRRNAGSSSAMPGA